MSVPHFLEEEVNFLSKLLQGISFLPSIVSAVEGLFGSKSGTQKKDAALGFISAALNLGEAITDQQVVDAAKFQDGLSKVIDGVVQCLNASVWAKKAA
jgi:hypothetical protein